MPKEKESVGITLLDVLTNSFAAALLLMTIVAATVGSGEGEQQASAPGDGTDYMVNMPWGKYKELDQSDPKVLTVLLAFKGKDAGRVRLSANVEDERLQLSIQRGWYCPEHWSIFRQGVGGKKWSISFSESSLIPDSVYLLISIGNYGLKPITIPIQGNSVLFSAEELVKDDTDITIMGQPFQTYQ